MFLRLCLRAPTIDRKPFGFPLPVRHATPFGRREVLAGQRMRIAHDVLRRALRDDVPALRPGARSHVENMVRRHHGFRIVLDDHDRIAEIAQSNRASAAGGDCPVDGARSTARRECRARRRGRSRSAWRAGCAGLHRRTMWPPADPASGNPSPTFTRKPSRSRISFKIRWAINISRSVNFRDSKKFGGRPDRKLRHFGDRLLGILTDRLSGLSRAPWQTSQSSSSVKSSSSGDPGVTA